MSYTYDVIVIGGGAAGLTASGIAANFGAKTMMIERHRLGGDCTWTGCVPSKAILKAAKVAHYIREAAAYGIVEQPLEVDFAKVIGRVRHIREEVYQDADSPEIYEKMGIDVRSGQASFVDAHTIELAHEGTSERFSGRFIVIAAGASAFVPPIEGLQDVPYLTNESLFEINELPKRLAIVGGGPIGTEMSQAFARLGSQVTVIDQGPVIMSKDDPELAGMLQQHLQNEGVRYVMNAGVKRVYRQNGHIAIEAEVGGRSTTIEADALLMATGRAANVAGLNLEAADVKYTNRGIPVNESGRTNVKHIYAIGDIAGRYQFTHMSEHMAKVAMTRMLLKVPMKIDMKHVPWVTFTEPELGHVGATREELKKRGVAYEEYRFPYTKVDRAVTEGETTGLIKVYAKAFSGKILGVDILGISAGELIGEYAVAMRNGISLRQIADTIHPYPTYALGARRAADQWYVQKQSAGFVKLLQFLFRYKGQVNAYVPGTVV
ncbi:MAG: FAD-dependent oxidoreductase [Rhodothermales bacterium]|nr:FAD-dependent oxidoreductase [Rhodothermales bacterium]